MKKVDLKIYQAKGNNLGIKFYSPFIKAIVD
jgi:hypothetical protein